MNPFADIYNSFKNNPDGLSGRKMSAFWAIVIVATVLAFKNTDTENALHMVIVWLVFGLICLGLVTIPDLIKFILKLKYKSKDEESNGANSN